MEPYIYEPLESGQIRLFNMDSSPVKSDQITGTMYTVALRPTERPLEYTALSYSWGNTYDDGSHLTDFIVCNGSSLKVTPNLKQALVRIRQLSEAQKGYIPAIGPELPMDGSNLLLLWIDALCINQQDLQERADQVKMMASIYKFSSDLIIWLGDLAPGHLGDKQYNTLRDLGSHITKMRGIVRFPTKRHSRFRILLGQIDKATEYSKSHNMTERQVLDTVLERSWFSRRWVLQECEMAPSERTHLLMGEAVFHRKNFEQLLRRHDRIDSALPLKARTDNLDALQFCYQYIGSLCSDPRDAIFAILHLCTDAHKIDVDYNQDVRDTYLSFVKKTVLDIPRQSDAELPLRSTDSWEFRRVRDKQVIRMLALASCMKGASKAQPLLLEKWVPDWRVKPTYDSSSHMQAVKNCLHVETPDGLAQISCAIRVAPDGYHYLRLKGMLLPALRGCYEQLHPPAQRDSMPLATDDMIQSLISDIKRTCPENLDRVTDRIWLAWAAPDDNASGKPLVILFALRTAERAALFAGRPAYFLHACFGFYAGPGVSFNEDFWRIFSERKMALALKQSLARFGVLSDEEFYLE